MFMEGLSCDALGVSLRSANDDPRLLDDRTVFRGRSLGISRLPSSESVPLWLTYFDWDPRILGSAVEPLALRLICELRFLRASSGSTSLSSEISERELEFASEDPDEPFFLVFELSFGLVGIDLGTLELRGGTKDSGDSR
jgi:hypothetical protein